jgi:hypothetical protein
VRLKESPLPVEIRVLIAVVMVISVIGMGYWLIS